MNSTSARLPVEVLARAILAHIGLSGTLIVLFAAAPLLNLTLMSSSRLLLAVTIAIGGLILVAYPQRLWSLPFLFYATLALFHTGLYVQPAIDGTKPVSLQNPWSGWYTESSMVPAAYLILVFCLAYAGILGAVSWWRHSSESARSAAVRGRDGQAYSLGLSSYSDVGGALVSIGVIVWLGVGISSLGLGFFTSSYVGFLTATASSPLSYAYMLISIGAPLCALDLRSPFSRLGASLFVAFAALALLLGLRNAVLIPIAAAMVVFGRINLRPPVSPKLRWLTSTRFALLCILVALTVISGVQQLRITGAGDIGDGGATISPLAAIEEMGGSVRVVVTSLEWHNWNHEQYAYGLTYTTPFSRAISAILGTPRPTADSDWGLMNVAIADRVGQIGGSIIGEAHHNFGWTGVFIVAVIAGIVSAVFAVGENRRATAPLAGLATLLLLMHVRNSFAPLLLWCVIGIFAIGVGKLLSLRRPVSDSSGAPRLEQG